MKHIGALIDDGGEVTIGAVDGASCAATAADAHNTLVVLVRRDGETFTALLKRLDRAIAKFENTGEPTDEINSASD